MQCCAQGAAAAMFPYEDENDDLQWDEYGAALRPDEFQLRATSRAGQTLPSPLPTCLALIYDYASVGQLHLLACACISTDYQSSSLQVLPTD